MNLSLTRILTPLALSTVFMGSALASSAHAANSNWLAVSGATGYRASSLTSREPVIYAKSLDSLREKQIGVAPGYVSSDGATANKTSLAVTVSEPDQVSLMLFSKDKRSIKIDVSKDTECPSDAQGPAEFAFKPLHLASDGELTYLKRSASTNCEFWLVRRDRKGTQHRLWTPNGAAPLADYSVIEVRGKLVLLGSANQLTPADTIVYNSVTQKLVYSLPKYLTPFYRVHLASTSSLGLTYIHGKRSSAVRVNLKNRREVRFEFPHRANAVFCGKYTVFAGAHLIKAYDEAGRTRFRQPTGDFSIYGYPELCSPKYAPIFGARKGKAAGVLLSLTDFKLRRLD